MKLGCERQSRQTVEGCTNDERCFFRSIETNRTSGAWRMVDSCRNEWRQWSKSILPFPNFNRRDFNLDFFFCIQKKSKTFQIAEYVLPKFETTIDSPSHFTIKDEKIRLIVRSKYTHGKFVRGKAIVSLTPLERHGNVVIKTVPMDGKGVVEFDIETELKLKSGIYFYDQEYSVRAIVLEELTGKAVPALHINKCQSFWFPFNRS